MHSMAYTPPEFNPPSLLPPPPLQPQVDKREGPEAGKLR